MAGNISPAHHYLTYFLEMKPILTIVRLLVLTLDFLNLSWTPKDAMT